MANPLRTHRAGRIPARLALALMVTLGALATAQAGGAVAVAADFTVKPQAGSPHRGSAVQVRRLLRILMAQRRRLRPPKPAPTEPAPSKPAPVSPAPEPAPPPPPPPADGAAAYPGRVGMASHTIWYQSAKQLDHLRRMRASGLTWAREDFGWGAFEPRQGVWEWHIGDTFMRNASIAGVNVLAVLAYSAGWAASGPSIYHPPRNPAEYANFARRIVERYGRGGVFWRENPSLDPRPITAVEIWNEPWLHDFWKPNPDPAAYARLLRAAATAIRAADPAVKILASADLYGSNASEQPVTWFSVLLQHDPQLFRELVDAYSVHAYSQDRSPMDTVTKQLWRFDRFEATYRLGREAGATHPIWVTEFGWSTYQGHPDGVSESLQALYTRQALQRAHVEFAGMVERSFIYQWSNPSEDRVGGFSLHRMDGSPKPVLGVLESLLR